MSKIPAPNPAAFDGQWVTPAQMAALAGISTVRLARLDRAGKLPAAAVERQAGGWRRYDAGKILAARQAR